MPICWITSSGRGPSMEFAIEQKEQQVPRIQQNQSKQTKCSPYSSNLFSGFQLVALRGMEFPFHFLILGRDSRQ